MQTATLTREPESRALLLKCCDDSCWLLHFAISLVEFVRHVISDWNFKIQFKFKLKHKKQSKTNNQQRNQLPVKSKVDAFHVLGQACFHLFQTVCHQLRSALLSKFSFASSQASKLALLKHMEKVALFDLMPQWATAASLLFSRRPLNYCWRKENYDESSERGVLLTLKCQVTFKTLVISSKFHHSTKKPRLCL